MDLSLSFIPFSSVCLFLLLFQCTHGVQDRNDRNSDICENSFPHIGCAKAPSSNTIAFTPSAKTMFCFTIDSVFLEILTIDAILRTSSSISTTSAASIAASDPMLPMAMPISALVSTGASLMPSPTNASFSFFVFFPSGGVLPVPPYLPAAVLHVLHQYQALLPLP